MDEGFVRHERVNMNNGSDVFTITIRRRPWWFWFLAALWLLSEIVMLQTAFSSLRESEYRAATISSIIAGVLLAVEIIVWMSWGRSRGRDT